eukprot:CAMPEP_0174253484 /NCGR_PEP_ID=MMETSP0439-20130205/2847_1 /TAXON_ID=0 /ORGANISM="Stereomyxa ramosa, Strain Chinc5" /LENGTH=538 /DNA_ID=CAMNT_0015334533 /DNA_START=30 /DNA_END=1643 /DNA_ORIENTATION=+
MMKEGEFVVIRSTILEKEPFYVARVLSVVKADDDEDGHWMHVHWLKDPNGSCVYEVEGEDHVKSETVICTAYLIPQEQGKFLLNPLDQLRVLKEVRADLEGNDDWEESEHIDGINEKKEQRKRQLDKIIDRLEAMNQNGVLGYESMDPSNTSTTLVSGTVPLSDAYHPLHLHYPHHSSHPESLHLMHPLQQDQYDMQQRLQAHQLQQQHLLQHQHLQQQQMRHLPQMQEEYAHYPPQIHDQFSTGYGLGSLPQQQMQQVSQQFRMQQQHQMKASNFPSQKRKRKRRPKTTREETQTLQTVFMTTNGYPKTEERAKLARLLGWTERSVQIWFQNKRRIEKSKGKDHAMYRPYSRKGNGKMSKDDDSICNVDHINNSINSQAIQAYKESNEGNTAAMGRNELHKSPNIVNNWEDLQKRDCIRKGKSEERNEEDKTSPNKKRKLEDPNKHHFLHKSPNHKKMGMDEEGWPQKEELFVGANFWMNQVRNNLGIHEPEWPREDDRVDTVTPPEEISLWKTNVLQIPDSNLNDMEGEGRGGRVW